jgi:hypothetical protein
VSFIVCNDTTTFKILKREDAKERNGRMEEWKDGRMEEWKSGRREPFISFRAAIGVCWGARRAPNENEGACRIVLDRRLGREILRRPEVKNASGRSG